MSTPTVVYVVTAVMDDDLWIAGVYTTEEGAQDVVRRLQTAREIWEEWKEAEDEIYFRAETRFRSERGFSSIHAHYLFPPYVEAELEKTPLPPEPMRESVEECWYRAVPVDQCLGKHSTAYQGD